MRLGLTLRTLHRLQDAIDLAIAAENAGLDTVYIAERHFDQGDGFANPFAVAAAISGRLRRLWIGVAPSLGMEHPLRLVEQANMLDILTHGRSRVVLSDRLEPGQYAAFGLPVPRNGLLEDLLQRLDEAWSWQYHEDSPALEFQSGPYAAKMAGRIMPSGRPHVALETDSEVGLRDAARRGWAVHLRLTDVDRTRSLIDVYREALTSAGHTTRQVEDALDGLAVVVGERPGPALDRLDALGAAEVRLDTSLEHALRMMR